MKITERDVNGVVVLELVGNVMGGPDASSLNEKLHELIEAGKTRIVVNLQEVKLMNSSGLGMLISGFTTIRNHGGDIKLANVSERIQNLLTITKLLTVFETYDSVDKAIQSFT